MSDDTVLETTIHEPSMTAGEAEMLLFALERSRAQFAWKCGGLDAAGLGHRHPPSTMTLGGLVKHLALVEDWTAAWKLKGQSPGAPWDAADFESDPDWEWRTGGGGSTRGALRAVAGSRGAVAGRHRRGAGGRRPRPARRS